jgi:RNA polymerase sigma-70 factor (ECF subfamily)
MSMVEETAIGGAGREFPGTRWTMILASRDGTQERRRALAELLDVYWKPLYFYVRRKGRTIEASKDAIQGFFAHLLERDFLGRLDPARGRFRSYLRAAMDHFLANEHEAATAQKRGGDARIVPLEWDAAERQCASSPADADAAFDREWAVGVIERAIARLRREFEEGMRKGSVDVAMRHFQGGDPPPYAESAAACGMSPARFKAFLHRTRARFRELLREEVAPTLDDTRETDSEIEYLLKALGS